MTNIVFANLQQKARQNFHVIENTALKENGIPLHEHLSVV